MSKERREHVRRDVNFPCWLGEANTSQLIEGRVRNISAGGAKVVCYPHTEVPDTVDFYMTQDGKVVAVARSFGARMARSG